MNDPIVDKILADLIKGAQASEGFVRGSRANVEIQRHGEEQKLAGHSGLGAAFGGPVGAALGADPGRELEAAKGSFMGGLKGTSIGAGIGAGLGGLAALTGGGAESILPLLLAGGGIGSYAGSIAGAAGAGDKPSLLDRLKGGSLDEACAAGVKAACDRFGIKEAFLGALMPMLGSVAGPALARAGAARFAPGLAQMASKGLGSHAFDMGASALGGAVGQRLAGPQQA